MSENIDVIKATESVQNAQKLAEQCPLRPNYHFLAPANWMNDPNGLIYYKDEYHIFYQHNPYGVNWGNIHWGHAKSKDLVNWKHLPIALAPSVGKGEKHCYSGCCVLDGGIPTIIYTSIKSIKSQINDSEQWLATSNDELITWKKDPDNPIMTHRLHKDFQVNDWRDPFIWKDNERWYAVLGGHLVNPTRPGIFLYRSTNLHNWEFLQPLYIERRSKGRNWECPNFFNLKDSYVLIVSSDRKVIYAVGDYKNFNFIPEKWHNLDNGRLFYATNILRDKKERIILLAWIKAKGNKGWNGCLTLPRLIGLGNDNKLIYEPIPELKKLREKHYTFKNLELSNETIQLLKSDSMLCVEVIANIEIIDAEMLGFKITNRNEIFKTETIGYNNKIHNFWAGNDFFKYEVQRNILNLHIFIDKSVIEIFINKKACLTTQIMPTEKYISELSLFTQNGKIRVNNLDIWKLKSIWEKKNNIKIL